MIIYLLIRFHESCQDLSLAGKRAGMNDTSTRSGMLWEVERILKECYELKTLPQILLMENVPQVHSQDNLADFHKWQLTLEELGYKNYMQDLIATDYGIPQTRNRCFMISILGDYSYSFPLAIPLKLKLKDLLENNVDESFYLSDKQIKDVENWNAYEKPLDNMEKMDKSNISQTITTRSGDYTSSMILVKDEENMKTKLCNELIDSGKIQENDVIRHSYTNSRMNGEMKDIKQNNISPTLDTRCDCLGVCVGTYDFSSSEQFLNGKGRFDNNKDTFPTLRTSPKDGVVTIGNYSPSNHNASRIIDSDYSAPTVMENHGTVTATNVGLRIRKLTPKECFRLMGVKDEDFENCAKNQSNASLYHLAGDSIVVNVLMAIFRELI